jgi:hypothetical protein
MERASLSLGITFTRNLSPYRRQSLMPHIINENSQYVKVGFTRKEINEFNSKWPGSKLQDRSYWFDFSTNGDLVDTDVPEQDEGSESLALSQDAWQFYQDELENEE